MSTNPTTLDSFLGPLDIESIEGICFPAPAGDASDLWYRLLVKKLAHVTPRLLDRATKEAPARLAPGLEATRAVLDGLSPADWISTFRSPVAYQPLDNDTSVEGRGIDAALTWSLGLPRFLVGAPDVTSMHAIFASEVVPAEGLYLPHLHALLAPGMSPGPISVQTDAATIEFVWSDGHALTLPRDPRAQEDLRGMDLPRFRFLPHLARWPLLNGVPEVRSATARFWEAMRGPAVRADDVARGWQPDDGARQIFAEGLSLLEQVWPEAATNAMRHVRGLVFLPHKNDGHYHSYSTVKLHGALVTTALNRTQVADVLVHETAHTRMSPLFELDPLIVDDGAAIHPSPWRADPRPIKGLLNGVQAFANVHMFYARLPDLPDWPRSRSERICEEQRAKLVTGWRYILEHTTPTPLGARVFEALDRAVKAL